MFIPKVLLYLFFLYNCNALTRQCSDCTLFRSCPEAIRYSDVNENEEAEKKLKSAFCGLQNTNGKRLPKVCCSDFGTTSDRSGIPDDETKAQSLESHPSVEFLPKQCGKFGGDRIVGGTIASLWEFPWMALLSYKTRAAGKNHLQFQCGATIINTRYVLTAAHCVVNKLLAGVRVGELDIKKKYDCQSDGDGKNICESHIQDLLIEESIPHKDYQQAPVKNDIALIRLSNPIDMAHNNTKPICLPLQENLRNLDLGNKIGTVAGWGVTETGVESNILRKVDVPIYTKAACQALYNLNSPHLDATLNKLCAGEIKKDSCSGDSGGPLMREEEVENIYRMVQFGVVSYGPKQCGTAFPGVYTDVRKYMDWILDNIKSY